MDDDRLDELWAKQTITEVLHRYCRGIDRMDAPLTLSCWHPDGTADYGGLYEGPASGFVDWLWPVHAAMIGHHHEVSNILIELHQDRAASETYVVVTLRVPHADFGDVDIVGRGRYLDRWERRDGRWGIVHRHYVSDLSETRVVQRIDISDHLTPHPGAPARTPSSRDRSDPSYDVFRDRA